MSKLTSTLLLLFVTGSSAIAQNIDENNIYYRALKEYARYVERFEPETDSVYFEEVKGITTNFPKEIRNIKVEIITGRNQQSIYTAHGNKLIHRKMTPAQVTDGKINISIIPYEGQYLESQGGLRLGLSKWHSVIFEYKPDTKRFEYVRMDNNG